MWPEPQERRLSQEKIAEALEVLQDEHAALAVHRELEMTEDDYLKMTSIKYNLPSLEGHDEGTLSETVILAHLFLSELVSMSLNEMEAHRSEHDGKWD